MFNVQTDIIAHFQQTEMAITNSAVQCVLVSFRDRCSRCFEHYQHIRRTLNWLTDTQCCLLSACCCLYNKPSVWLYTVYIWLPIDRLLTTTQSFSEGVLSWWFVHYSCVCVFNCICDHKSILDCFCVSDCICCCPLFSLPPPGHPLLQTISTGLGRARKSADSDNSEILRWFRICKS